MRGTVQFKFKASNVYDSVSFDEAFISVGELKRSIIQKKKLEKATDFELQITNSQTGEVYKEDAELLPRNTAVIVKRVPLAQAVMQRARDNGQDIELPPVTKDDDEAAMIAALVEKESADWQMPDQRRRMDQFGIPPPHYVCKQCGQKGHFFSKCPMERPAIPAPPKKPTGIPRSMLRAVNRTSSMGMKLETGQSVILQPNERVFLRQTTNNSNTIAAAIPTQPTIPPYKVEEKSLNDTPINPMDTAEGAKKEEGSSGQAEISDSTPQTKLLVCALCHRGGHLAPDCPDHSLPPPITGPPPNKLPPGLSPFTNPALIQQMRNFGLFPPVGMMGGMPLPMIPPQGRGFMLPMVQQPLMGFGQPFPLGMQRANTNNVEGEGEERIPPPLSRKEFEQRQLEMLDRDDRNRKRHRSRSRSRSRLSHEDDEDGKKERRSEDDGDRSRRRSDRDRNRGRERERSGEKERERKEGRSRERERSEERDRERKEGRDRKERVNRDRSREKERRGEKERNAERSREKEGREKDRNEERSKDRDRHSRSRDGRHGKSRSHHQSESKRKSEEKKRGEEGKKRGEEGKKRGEEGKKREEEGKKRGEEGKKRGEEKKEENTSETTK